MSEFDPIAWAGEEATRLRAAAKRPEFDARSGPNFFAAAPHAYAARYEASAALEFLRRNADGTELYKAASDGLESNVSAYRYLDGLASILDQFVAGQSSGMLSTLAYEVASRVDAATDLMEQVEFLLSDGAVHAAAPVVLAGATWKSCCRARCHTVPFQGSRGWPPSPLTR